jgi:ADP-ribosylglycohydrolase
MSSAAAEPKYKLLVKSDSVADRAAGAIMGVLIGDALGCGCHWYYDTDMLKARYGRVTNYVKPAADWYHAGMKAGQLSQTGIMTRLLLESVAEKGGYVHEDYCARFDSLLDQCDGTPRNGPGGYTDQNVREVWTARKVNKLAWGADGVAAWTDTAEAAHRVAVLSARYALDLSSMTSSILQNTRMTYADPFVTSHSATYGALLGLLVAGEPFDASVAGKLRKLDWSGAVSKEQDPERYVPNVDALLQPGFIARAAGMKDGINIQPELVSQMYGLSCQITCLLPASYFIAARYNKDFETGVLAAINGGGNNMARAALTGGLLGAQVGFTAIPSKFIEGLEEGPRLAELAQRVGIAAQNKTAMNQACALPTDAVSSDCGCPTGV